MSCHSLFSLLPLSLCSWALSVTQILVVLLKNIQAVVLAISLGKGGLMAP